MKTDTDNVIKRATEQTLDEVLAPYLKDEWGFTGTRAGMRGIQNSRVRSILTRGDPAIVRHGAAYGADTEFHAIWRETSPKRFADVWPADASRVKLFDGQDNVHVNPIFAPLTRNEEIVKRSKLMLAAPQSSTEVVRSGTWATVRYARKLNIPILIIWPSGILTFDWNHFLSRVTI